MAFDWISLKQAVSNGRIEWRRHTLQRIAERHVLQQEVIDVLLAGEVISGVSGRPTVSSALVFGWIADRPVHVVVSYDRMADLAYIITVYEPSLDVFESDFKTKRE